MTEKTEKNLAYAFAAESKNGGVGKYLKVHNLLISLDVGVETIERK